MDTVDLAHLATNFAVLTALRTSGNGNGNGSSGTDGTLGELTQLAVDVLADADFASVTLAGRGSFRTLCSTDPDVLAVDNLQHALGEGPSLQACRSGDSAVCEDLRSDEKWPRFAAAALELGIHAVMSFRLQVQPDDKLPASLNVYARKPWAFAQDGAAVGSLLVAHMNLVLAAGRAQTRAENLEKALDSNRAIGVAMGILMARYNVTEPQAFVMLRRASQGLNRKIRDIADDVSQTGELPALRSGLEVSVPA